MQLQGLAGLMVALAVPVWLAVEEMLHRRRPADQRRVRTATSSSATMVPAETAAGLGGTAA
jgi:hypothetical protein